MMCCEQASKWLVEILFTVFCECISVDRYDECCHTHQGVDTQNVHTSCILLMLLGRGLGLFPSVYMEYAEIGHNCLHIPHSYLMLLYSHISKLNNTIKL
jgi:hypothetical protein